MLLYMLSNASSSGLPPFFSISATTPAASWVRPVRNFAISSWSSSKVNGGISPPLAQTASPTRRPVTPQTHTGTDESCNTPPRTPTAPADMACSYASPSPNGTKYLSNTTRSCASPTPPRCAKNVALIFTAPAQSKYAQTIAYSCASPRLAKLGCAAKQHRRVRLGRLKKSDPSESQVQTLNYASNVGPEALMPC